jgi:hypothetical protein
MFNWLTIELSEIKYTWQTKAIIIIIIYFSGSAAQGGLWPPRITRFLDHTQRLSTVGRTPLNE